MGYCVIMTRLKVGAGVTLPHHCATLWGSCGSRCFLCDLSSQGCVCRDLCFLFLLLFFNFTILYWFCHTSTWIHHRYTRVPHPEPPILLPPYTIPLGHPSAPAPSILYHASNLDWWFVSYLILYMFQCHSPKSFPTSLSHRVQKTVLYISVSFAVLLTGLSLPSF